MYTDTKCRRLTKKFVLVYSIFVFEHSKNTCRMLCWQSFQQISRQNIRHCSNVLPNVLLKVPEHSTLFECLIQCSSDHSTRYSALFECSYQCFAECYGSRAFDTMIFKCSAQWYIKVLLNVEWVLIVLPSSRTYCFGVWKFAVEVLLQISCYIQRATYYEKSSLRAACVYRFLCVWFFFYYYYFLFLRITRFLQYMHN